jgi:hypothetical protein
MLLFSIFIVSLAVKGDKRPQDMTVVLIKILISWGTVVQTASLSMSYVITRRQLVIGEQSTEWCLLICRILGMSGGALLLEQPVFSSNCLIQQLLTHYNHLGFAAKQDSAKTLVSVKHSEWFDQRANGAAQGDLAYVQHETEYFQVAFWALAPLAIGLCIYFFCAIYVSMTTRCHKRYHARAMRFYDELTHGEDSTVEELVGKEGKWADRAEEWTVYAREHGNRLCNLWWSVSHAAAQKRCKMLSWVLFFEETQALVMFATIFIYSPVVFGVSRPMNCISSGRGAGLVWKSKFAAELECGTGAQFIMSVVCSIIWGLLAPLLLFAFLSTLKTSCESDPRIRSRYSILLNGYNVRYWYWESVVCLMKSIVMLSGAYVQPDNGNGVLLSVALLYGALCMIVSPYDPKCNRILRTLNGHFIFVWIAHCLAVQSIWLINPDGRTASQISKMEDHALRIWLETRGTHTDGLLDRPALLRASHRYNEPEMATWGPLVVCCLTLAVHLLFVGNLFRRMAKYTLQTYISSLDLWEYEVDKHTRSCGPTMALKRHLMNWHHKQQRDAAYASFDSLFGWTIVCGNRGDVAKKPHIPRGRGFPEGRPRLSELPTVPTECDGDVTGARKATGADQAFLHRSLARTVEVLGTKLENSTFSVSLMEFTIRAAFERAHISRLVMADHLLVKTYWEDFDHTIDLAKAELDPLDEVQRLDKMPTRVFQPGELGIHADADGRVLSIDHGSQAEALGVQVGWAIHTVDGEAYSNEILNKFKTTLTKSRSSESFNKPGGLMEGVELSRREYSVTFKELRPLDKDPVAEGDAHSRALSAVRSRGSTAKVPKEALSDHLTMTAFQQLAHDVHKEELKRRGRFEPVTVTAQLQHHDAEAENRVRRMFHPEVFARGVELDTLQHALIELRRIPPKTLQEMLDIFEEMWLLHNAYLANRLKRYTGKIIDRKEQAGATFAGAMIEKSPAEEPHCEFYDRIGDEEKLDQMEVRENDPRSRGGVRTVEVQVGSGLITRVLDSTVVASVGKTNAPQFGAAWEQEKGASTILHWTRFMILIGKGLNGTGLDLHSAVLARQSKVEKIQRSISWEEEEVEKKNAELLRVQNEAAALRSQASMRSETPLPPRDRDESAGHGLFGW